MTRSPSSSIREFGEDCTFSSGVMGVSRFPSEHFGKLYGTVSTLSTFVALLQYPCFALISGPLHGDPSLVSHTQSHNLYKRYTQSCCCLFVYFVYLRYVNTHDRKRTFLTRDASNAIAGNFVSPICLSCMSSQETGTPGRKQRKHVGGNMLKLCIGSLQT